MPYYEKINTLFIHIPRTGGSSLENYLKTKSPQTVYTQRINTILPEPKYHNKSLQHQFYTVLYQYRDLLKIRFDSDLKIITIVRNPYARAVSDLIYNKLVKPTDSPEAFCTALKWFLQSDEYDNHQVPQHRLLTDELGNLIDGMWIFKNETLAEDLKEYGFADYTGTKSGIDYLKCINSEFIVIINLTYSRDFDLFGYRRLKP